MNSELIVFLVLSLVAIATALGMLFSRNAVYAALFLALNFVAVAIFYLLLGAPFVAMAQITVYAGAIMVLFLFVIMLLGVKDLEPTRALPWQKPLAIALSVILAAEATYVLLAKARTTMMVASPDASLNTMESLRNLSVMLFSDYLFPFEVTSILLLVAMIGAIVLSHRNKKETK
ncbi:MAG: NADH-quinone oxidoreductase subunit J [Anaerolineales bacterium]|nr:NADH-quinone oxidoreductase subunit J [Anaerolineales bacterium]